MKRILVIHGAGMDMRGKFAIETFGPMLLPEYDVKIRAYAGELGVAIDIFHSNSEGVVIDRLYAAHDANYDGAIINPAGSGVMSAATNTSSSASNISPVYGHNFSTAACARRCDSSVPSPNRISHSAECRK